MDSTFFVHLRANGHICLASVEGDTLELLQNLVGGYIQEAILPLSLRKEIRPNHKIALWADEEGLMKGYSKNKFIAKYAGDLVLSLVNEEGECVGFTRSEIYALPQEYRTNRT
jgi:hypothetical protein